MSRALARSFFWIDQNIIRQGVWAGLSAQARLAYVALSASVDREGVSIWSKKKLMEVAACPNPDEFEQGLIDLESRGLIQRHLEAIPPAISICNIPVLDGSGPIPKPHGGLDKPSSALSPSTGPGTSITIHNHINLPSGDSRHAGSETSS